MNPLNQIADELDELAGLDLATMSHDAIKLTIRSYAVALRAMASASPATVSRENPETHHRRMIEEAKAELRAGKTASDESREVQAFECADGPCEGVTVTLPVAMPVGAHTHVEGSIYSLGKDGKLHHGEPPS